MRELFLRFNWNGNEQSSPSSTQIHNCRVLCHMTPPIYEKRRKRWGKPPGHYPKPTDPSRSSTSTSTDNHWPHFCFVSDRKKCPLRRKMYESSCSYQGALELKRSSTSAYSLGIKSEEFGTAGDWPAYRFCNPSTFEQLKQSVEKAKAALQVSTDYIRLFGSADFLCELFSG